MSSTEQHIMSFLSFDFAFFAFAFVCVLVLVSLSRALCLLISPFSHRTSQRFIAETTKSVAIAANGAEILITTLLAADIVTCSICTRKNPSQTIWINSRISRPLRDLNMDLLKIYIYIHVYIYMYACKYVCIPIYIYTCIYTYTYCHWLKKTQLRARLQVWMILLCICVLHFLDKTSTAQWQDKE